MAWNLIVLSMFDCIDAVDEICDDFYVKLCLDDG